jgi:predicted transcriptional regulator
MAQQPSRRRGSAAPAARKFVMPSVRLDVATHARVSAAAALACLDKSAWMSRAITEALHGVVVIDRRKAAEQGDPPGEERSADPG